MKVEATKNGKPRTIGIHRPEEQQRVTAPLEVAETRVASPPLPQAPHVNCDVSKHAEVFANNGVRRVSG
jgi:hypothetical protein